MVLRKTHLSVTLRMGKLLMSGAIEVRNHRSPEKDFSFIYLITTLNTSFKHF